MVDYQDLLTPEYLLQKTRRGSLDYTGYDYADLSYYI